MKPFAVLLALSIMCSSLFAASLVAPISTQIEQDSQVIMGNVGPGQTFFVIVQPEASTGGKFGIGGSYDQMFASQLPYKWASTPSRLYAKPLQTDITVPKDAADGEYEVELTLWDEAGEEGLGDNITFTVKVTVTKDVMDMKIEPTSQSVGASQPARYAITILNKGIANDVFTVGSIGVRDWEFTRSVYIRSGTSKTINYELVGNEESDYQVTIWARSSSSDSISASLPVFLRVNTDLLSDFKAVNRGLLLFPVAEAPIYFVVGLISNLFQ